MTNGRADAPEGSLVTTAEGVEAVADGIRAAGAFTLDLEFVPEGRYVPDLGLVQVGWDDGGGIDSLAVAAIDPLAVDATPVLTLVGDPEIETITHAAQGDLAILAHRFSVHAQALRDTQIAAAFLGFGDQIGYAPLVESTIGVHLEKGSQYTEWLRRPLTSEQLTYALDDVRYLGMIWEQQRQALSDDGRLQSVLEECARLAETAASRPPPEEAYRRVKGWSGLRSRPLGALRQLAAWREREARRSNRPPSRVLNDRSMLELARAAPSSEDGLHAVRGVDSGIVRHHSDKLIRAIREGAADPRRATTCASRSRRRARCGPPHCTGWSAPAPSPRAWPRASSGHAARSRRSCAGGSRATATIRRTCRCSAAGGATLSAMRSSAGCGAMPRWSSTPTRPAGSSSSRADRRTPREPSICGYPCARSRTLDVQDVRKGGRRP